jgi:hypothetical protein
MLLHLPRQAAGFSFIRPPAGNQPVEDRELFHR